MRYFIDCIYKFIVYVYTTHFIIPYSFSVYTNTAKRRELWYGLYLYMKYNYISFFRPSFDISLPFFVPETFTSPSGNSDQLIGQTDQLIDSKSPLVSAIDRPWSLLVFENRLDMKLLQEFSNISHPAAIIVKPCQNQTLHQNLHFCHLGKDYSASQLVSESRFCFVSGVPSTLNFLLAQVLQQGCVPVILQEAAVLPFSEIIDWSLISVRIRRNEVGNIFNILKYVEPNYPTMQVKLAEVYAEYMSSPASIALTALRIINSRYSESVYQEKKI